MEKDAQVYKNDSYHYFSTHYACTHIVMFDKQTKYLNCSFLPTVFFQ